MRCRNKHISVGPASAVRHGFHQDRRGAGAAQGVVVNAVVVLVGVDVNNRQKRVRERQRVEVGGEIGIRVVLIRHICGVVGRRLGGTVRRDDERNRQARESREDAAVRDIW